MGDPPVSISIASLNDIATVSATMNSCYINNMNGGAGLG